MDQTYSKVPEATSCFWITKILTTGMGEVFSDFLVRSMPPVLAVVLGGILLSAALLWQFSVRRYHACVYWLTVVAVSIFGTMAADILHFVLGVPLIFSTTFFVIAQTILFVLWCKKEKTLSIHSIYTRRREFFYWATVLGTFALGTAAGDMTAYTMHLGFFASGLLFTGFIALPAVLYWLFGLNEIVAFWFAYIMTRPLGASFSDWMAAPSAAGGLGLGTGKVSLALSLIILILIGYLAITQNNNLRKQRGRKEAAIVANDIAG
jgi:uncharacterized membrane-anchored protein